MGDTLSDAAEPIKRNREMGPPSWATGRSSAYNDPYSSLPPGAGVFLCCRASTRSQGPSNAAQEKELRRAAQEHGWGVIGVRHYVGSGTDPAWLAGPAEAVRAAEAQGKVAALLFVSPNRKCRNIHYHNKKLPNAQATDAEWQYAEFITGGARSVMRKPDATPRDERSDETNRRGKAGRPRKVQLEKHESGWRSRRRAECLPLARQLRSKGLDYRTIAEVITRRKGFPMTHTTVRHWLGE